MQTFEEYSEVLLSSIGDKHIKKLFGFKRINIFVVLTGNKLPEYLSQKEHQTYERGQIKDPERLNEIEVLLAKDLDTSSQKILFSQLKTVSEASKVEHPELMVIHVLDRSQDDKEVFEYIESLGDYFVICFKKHYKDARGTLISFYDLTGEYDKITNVCAT